MHFRSSIRATLSGSPAANARATGKRAPVARAGPRYPMAPPHRMASHSTVQVGVKLNGARSRARAVPLATWTSCGHGEKIAVDPTSPPSETTPGVRAPAVGRARGTNFDLDDWVQAVTPRFSGDRISAPCGQQGRSSQRRARVRLGRCGLPQRRLLRPKWRTAKRHRASCRLRTGSRLRASGLVVPAARWPLGAPARGRRDVG
jgi:hypothetical protein